MSDLVVGEFRGYRSWKRQGDELHAAANTYQWPAAAVTAECRPFLAPRDRHPAPATGCTCGLYAYYRPSTVLPIPTAIFGVVSVAGRVILATRGMKAERMTILALVTDDEALGRRYGVPIYPSREALLSDFPPQDYSALVDVDPTDPPAPPANGVVVMHLHVSTHFFAGAMRDASEAASRLAARLGVSAQEAGRALESIGIAFDRPEHVGGDGTVDVKARALELRKTRNTGPAAGGFRRDGRRR